MAENNNRIKPKKLAEIPEIHEKSNHQGTNV
jgi:hypothetical protein